MSLCLSVAGHAHHRHAVECEECVSHAALLLEQRLAGVAPSLLIVRVAAVLNEACLGTIWPNHVAANYGSDARAVWAALNCQWLGVSHVGKAV
jgi:hypothetical protein